MDSTSEFDYICRITTLELYNKLPGLKQQEILAKTKEFVANAKGNASRNFSKLEKENNIKFMKDALSATEYVMNNKDRYAVMALVIKEFDDNPIFNNDFSEKYQTDLIKPRNDLAHNIPASTSLLKSSLPCPCFTFSITVLILSPYIPQ